jgi:hypothetical protein
VYDISTHIDYLDALPVLFLVILLAASTKEIAQSADAVLIDGSLSANNNTVLLINCVSIAISVIGFVLFVTHVDIQLMREQQQ